MKDKFLAFLQGFGTIFLYIIIASLGAFLFGDYYESSNKVVATLAQLGTYTLLFVILGLIYHKCLINDFKNYKKENTSLALKNWLCGLGIMMVSNIIINTIVGNIPTNETLNRNLLIKYPFSNIISMIFMGPLIEEITFRASFKNAFDKWYTFSLFTAIIFGLAHIARFDLLEFLFIIPYGALGFFFAKTFYETDNIYSSFLIHMLHNTMCIIIIFAM